MPSAFYKGKWNAPCSAEIEDACQAEEETVKGSVITLLMIASCLLLAGVLAAQQGTRTRSSELGQFRVAAPIYRRKDNASRPLLRVQAGKYVVIQARKDGWYAIRMEDGSIGWSKTSSILLVKVMTLPPPNRDKRSHSPRRLHHTSSLTAARSPRSADMVIRLPESVGSLTFSPTGRYLAMQADNHTYLWNFRTHRLRHLPPAAQIAFCSSEKCVALHQYNGKDDQNSIRIVEIRTGRTVKKVRLRDYPGGFSFSPDGSTLAWASGGEKEPWAVQLWNYRTGKSRSLVH